MLTAADKEIRKARIGGSEVPAVLGISPFAGPMDVWCRICHGIEKERAPELTIGNYLEPCAMQWYRDTTGQTTLPAASMVHAEHDWLSATPDGYSRGRYVALVEAKTSRNRDDWGADGTDEVPDYYAAQAQTQMAVTGETRVDMPVLFTQAYAFGLYVIERDDEVIAAIIETCGEWYRRHVVGGEMPALDGGNAAAEFLRRRYPGGQPLGIATEDEIALMRECSTDKAVEKAAIEKAAISRQRLVFAIGDRDGLVISGGRFRVTYKANKNGVRALRMTGMGDDND